MEEADRCVTPQPLQIRNRRKLNALPYHLLHSGRVQPLKEKCLLNFEFIFTKLRALNVGALFNEYREKADTDLLRNEEDIQLFLDFLQMSYNALTYDPNLLAYHIRESLKGCCEGHALLEALVTDAGQWIQNTKQPILMPVNAFTLQPADSPLKFSSLVGYDGYLTSDEQHMVCLWNEPMSNLYKINCINLKTKDLVASVPIDKPSPVAVTRDGKQFICCSLSNVRIMEIASGDQVQGFPHLAGSYEKVTIRDLVISDDGRLLAVSIRCGRPKGPDVGKQWRQTTRIVLVDLEQSASIREVEYKGKKHPEKIYFIHKGKQLLISAKDKITVYGLPGLNELASVPLSSDLHSQSQKIVASQNLLISGSASPDMVRVCLYDYAKNQLDFSKNTHKTEVKGVKVFGLCANKDASIVLCGSYVSTQTVYEECVCLWDRRDNKYTTIPLTHQPYKEPCSMATTPDWSYAMVGWTNGFMAMVDLQNTTEISQYQAHAHSIYNITFLGGGRHFITMSQDHYFKLWDFRRQVNKCREEFRAKSAASNSDGSECEKYLDEKEQSLELTCTDKYVITANYDHMVGPSFWHISDGRLDATVTSKIQEVYSASLERHNPGPDGTGKVQNLKDPTSGRTHGAVKLINGHILLYERKRRDFMAMWTFDIRDPVNPKLLGQYDASMAFFRVIDMNQDRQRQKCFVIRDGELVILSFPELKIENCIQIPRITDEIVNINSGGGKKKLLYYKVALTVDGKYLIISNPAAVGGTTNKLKKYFDLVNVRENRYVDRIALSKYVPWTMLDDGFYFLLEMQDDTSGIYPACNLNKLKRNAFKRKILIDSDKFLSRDKSLGFDVKNHLVYVWKINPLQHLLTLTGHVHEVTTICASRDNRYLATGSYDNTARIWSLSSGDPLCMFHTYGAIDRVKLTPSLSHLVVQCYAAPQKKRGLILEIKNMY